MDGLSCKEDQKMRTFVLFLVTGSALARPRDVQDRLHPEEVKHILGIEDEELAPRHVPHDPQGRHVGAGLGLNVGPLGAGFSTGLGNGGLGLNGALGVGNFQPWGTYNHYSQYFQPRYFVPQHHLQGRTLAHGLGFNVGPVGVGYQGGLGNGQLGFSGGLGWQGRYSHFGYPANYNRFWTQQAPGPIFHTDQLQK